MSLSDCIFWKLKILTWGAVKERDLVERPDLGKDHESVNCLSQLFIIIGARIIINYYCYIHYVYLYLWWLWLFIYIYIYIYINVNSIYKRRKTNRLWLKERIKPHCLFQYFLYIKFNNYNNGKERIKILILCINK